MKHTIALVDDDRNILTSLSIALEKEGFNIQTYLDGESALIGLSRTPPDLAVIDIKMPRMDGEELLKKLRKKTSMPIIFLTSKDEEVDELLGLKLGADDFVKKSGGFSTKTFVENPPDFLIKSSAPSFKPNNSSTSSSLEVKNIIGIVVFFLNLLKSSSPSILGILISKTAKSGGFLVSPIRADSPSMYV